MLRETDPQAGLTLWEALLPEQARRLPAELAKIDTYLDDERFIARGEPCSTDGLVVRRFRSTPCCGCCI